MRPQRDQNRRPSLSVEMLDDNDLLRLTREGSDEAYAVLYDRYVYPARRLARHLGQREESDDVVAEAFAQIFDLLKRGKGPDRAFRAYLFTAIRHESGRRAKAYQRVMPTDDDSKIDSAVPFRDGQLDDFEKATIRAAYESLPPRWRTALWHLDVEGRRPGDLADVMGVKPNAVSALVYRARSGLRDAYLQQHVGTSREALPAECDSVRGKLASVLRHSSSSRDQAKVQAHLNSCRDCMEVYLSLQEVNRDIGTILTPAALAAAIGGGAVLMAAGGGSAIVANLFAVAKGLAVAAVPAAAVTATTVVVIGTASSSPPSAAQEAPAARAATPTAPAEQGLAGGPGVGAASTPKVATAGTAPGVVTDLSVEPAPSADRRPAPSSAPAAPSQAPPSQSAPNPAPTPKPPVQVVVDPKKIEVSLGPVKVSTDDLEETVDDLLKLPKDLLSGLTPTPAP